MMKKIVGVIILILIMLVNTNYAFAVEVSVDSHVDGFTSGDTWQITRSGTQMTSSESGITIDDQTGNNGWIFTVNVTDFTETLIDDPTVAVATLSVKVDVEDWLTMTLKDSTSTAIVTADIPATIGTDIPAAGYTVINTITGSGNVNILEIEPGYGTGLYNLEIDYTITLDDWLPNGTTITSTAASGVFSSASPVTVNNATQKYQMFVGTYETTITYSVASNPP